MLHNPSILLNISWVSSSQVASLCFWKALVRALEGCHIPLWAFNPLNRSPLFLTCGRAHAHLNLDNSLQLSSFPPATLSLHLCPFPAHSFATRWFTRELFSHSALSLALVRKLLMSSDGCSVNLESTSDSLRSLLTRILMQKTILDLILLLLPSLWHEYVFSTVSLR